MSPVVHPTDTIAHAKPKPTIHGAELQGMGLMLLSHHRCFLHSLSLAQSIFLVLLQTHLPEPSQGRTWQVRLPVLLWTPWAICLRFLSLYYQNSLWWLQTGLRIDNQGFWVTSSLWQNQGPMSLGCSVLFSQPSACPSCFSLHTHTQPSWSGFPPFCFLK